MRPDVKARVYSTWSAVCVGEGGEESKESMMVVRFDKCVGALETVEEVAAGGGESRSDSRA